MPDAIDIRALAAAVAEPYANTVLAEINDHVLRMSVMTGPFHWHCHPDSDELFLCVEGGLRIELADGVVELAPGEAFSVPAGAVHRTSPLGARSVNLTVDSAGAETREVRAPG